MGSLTGAVASKKVNPALKEMKFSVEIRRYGDLNEILRRIGQTKRVKFEIKDRTINVYE